MKTGRDRKLPLMTKLGNLARAFPEWGRQNETLCLKNGAYRGPSVRRFRRTSMAFSLKIFSIHVMLTLLALRIMEKSNDKPCCFITGSSPYLSAFVRGFLIDSSNRVLKFMILRRHRFPPCLSSGIINRISKMSIDKIQYYCII